MPLEMPARIVFVHLFLPLYINQVVKSGSALLKVTTVQARFDDSKALTCCPSHVR